MFQYYLVKKCGIDWRNLGRHSLSQETIHKVVASYVGSCAKEDCYKIDVLQPSVRNVECFINHKLLSFKKKNTIIQVRFDYIFKIIFKIFYTLREPLGSVGIPHEYIHFRTTFEEVKCVISGELPLDVWDNSSIKKANLLTPGWTTLQDILLVKSIQHWGESNTSHWSTGWTPHRRGGVNLERLTTTAHSYLQVMITLNPFLSVAMLRSVYHVQES